MIPTVRLIAVTRPYEDEDYVESLGLNTALDLIEYAGRWDYGERSVAKMAEEGSGDVIARWLAGGEESMVEMADATFLITCSRVVSHELVRHRIASYQQESQRFVKYDEESPEGLFFVPPEVEAAGQADVYRGAMRRNLATYNLLKDNGVKSQIARYVLPNATRTRIIAKMNLREWRHVLRLRMHTSAQPEMQVIARQVHAKLQRAFGAVLFPGDIAAERAAR